MGAPIDPELTADAEEKGDVGPLGAGAGTSLHRQSPPRAPAPGGRQAQRSRRVFPDHLMVRAAQASPDHGFCGVSATGLVTLLA